MPRTWISALLGLAVLGTPLDARAATILFVADSDGDREIATALSADGHTVISVVEDFSTGRNPTLEVPLDAYDAVFWSADGTGSGSTHTDTAAFANLETYVMGGGRVFVTGYDSIASPIDALLIEFLGGTGARDTSTAPGMIASIESSLTVGVQDIRGLTPTASGDHDCLTGFSALTGTTLIAASGTDTSCAQWSVRRLGAGEIGYIANDGSGSEWTTVSSGAGGVYNAAIRNFAAAAGSSGSEPGAPDIAFDVPFANDEGAEILVSAIVEDLEGDLFTYTWDTDDDGIFGEFPDALDIVIPAGTTDGPGSIRIGVRAVDENGNTATSYRSIPIMNVPPRVVSEAPEFASVEVDLAYAIEVEDPAGDLDPLTFVLVDGPSGMSVNDSGLVSWVPGDADVTGVDELVRVEVSIDDGDEGVTNHIFELTVSPNRQPSTPLPVFPADGIGIIDRSPLFSIQNSEDQDLDPLSYLFEVDTVETFDSADRVRSEAVPEMAGYTSWQIPSDLDEDRRYYWRVRAFDGMIHSQWRGTRFFVLRDPALGPRDAGMPDAGPPGTDGGLPAVDAGSGETGGGCSVGRGPRDAAPLSLLALLGGLLLWRRRRPGR